MMPLVSVVVANFNYGRFIAACIDSVLAQTYPNVEIIVVDDGSTDESRDVIAGFGNRVRAILQPNRGQAAALAAGVAAARGEVICLLDSDDAWQPSKVQHIADTFERRSDVAWIRHKLSYMDADGQPLDGHTPAFRGSARIRPDRVLLAERLVSASTSAIALRRAAAERAFPLPDAGRFALDADAILLAQLFALGLYGYSLDVVLGSYRRHAKQAYTGRGDLVRLLRRQVEVNAAMCDILEMGESMSSCKHRAVLAALAGRSAWSGERAAALFGGLRASGSLVRRPDFFARQLAGLLLAYAAPTLWLRRLGQSQQLNLSPGLDQGGGAGKGA